MYVKYIDSSARYICSANIADAKLPYTVSAVNLDANSFSKRSPTILTALDESELVCSRGRQQRQGVSGRGCWSGGRCQDLSTLSNPFIGASPAYIMQPL